MCLKTVDERTKKGTGIGYKVFGRDDYYHILPTFKGRTRYKHETWYEDKFAGVIKADDDTFYPCGYHIFTNSEDAKRYARSGETTRKVKYENVVASGEQTFLKVIVARRMYIFKGKLK